MKESKFVEQNKKNWLEYETGLRSGINKSQHSRLFIQVTDDLSYARTFYKSRSVKVYLNGIAQLLFNNLYQNQSTNFKNFTKFWKYDLPTQIFQSRREFTISFLVFLLSFGIGILSSIYDTEFARLILGDDYVQMTIQNIKNHDPLAVYKDGNEATMFMGIALNNLLVALYTFVLGVFMSVGTILALLRNGVMVGTFQYFFIERDLFRESFLTIWQHGTIEISCIIIAGAAGLTLGKGLIYPGTYSRVNSLKISALRGLKIFLGITPLIILAGFIESFITRHTGINDVIRLASILLSLTFILFYFVWYPRFLNKKNLLSSEKKEKISYKDPVKYEFGKILSKDEMLGYSFKYFNQNILPFLLLVGGIAFVHSLFTVVFSLNQTNVITPLKTNSFISFFELKTVHIHFWLGIISLSFLQIYLASKIRKLLSKQPAGSQDYTGMVNLVVSAFVSSFLVLIPFYIGLFWGVVSLLFVSPFLFLATYKSFNENTSILNSTVESFTLLKGQWTNQSLNSMKLFGFVFVVYILTNTQVAWTYIESIFVNFNYNTDTSYLLELFVLTMIVCSLAAVFSYFLIVTSIFNYYAFKEIAFAEDLTNRIEMFGERNSLFGFEKEQ
ncbi:MAG TPA: stage II sporulation protein M [Bacteroidales bacterium]|nr:stage II sporulation protein M [Bacteroidales bacterium]